MSATEELKAMKPGECKLFPGYKRPSQLSAYIARLKPYSYTFRTMAVTGGVMVTRVARVKRVDVSEFF